MLYLYAIIDRPSAQLTPPCGVEDATPEILPFNDFSVVAGLLRTTPLRENAGIRCHMDVLNTLMRQCTVLPVRFGTVFPTYDELSQSMFDMQDTLLSDLRRLRGQVELGVCATARSTLPAPKITPDGLAVGGAFIPGQGPGFRYIAGKRAEHEQRLRESRTNEALAALVCAPFATLASEQDWHALASSAGRGISAAFLLPRHRFDAFQLVVTQLRRAEPDLDILCTGPWPPFSFVSDGSRTFVEGGAHGATASRNAYRRHGHPIRG